GMHDWSVARLLALSLVSTAAVLTRMDSLLIVGGLILLTLREAIKTGPSAKTKAWSGFCLLTPFMLLVGSWLVWKWSFYGSLLPNTFYVKVASLSSFRRGLLYIYLFLTSYLLVIFPFLFLLFVAKLSQKNNWRLAVLVILILLWLCYVVAVGGDFM